MESIDLLPIGMVTSAVLMVLASFFGGHVSRALKALGLAALVLAIAALTWNMKHTVRPGTVGVQVLGGETQPNALFPGTHRVHPQSHFQEMVTRRQMLDFSGIWAFRQTDEQGQTVTLEMAVPYKLSGLAAPYLFESIGPDDVYIPQLKQTARAAAGTVLAKQSLTDIDPAALEQLAMDIEGSIRLRVAESLVMAGYSEVQALTFFEFGRPEILNLCIGSCPANAPAPLAEVAEPN